MIEQLPRNESASAIKLTASVVAVEVLLNPILQMGKLSVSKVH